jgi:hypothetical protein
LSTIRRALEIAEPDRMKTVKAKAKVRTPASPLDRSESRRDATAPYSSRKGVDGRTKRCLYRLARISVAELVCGLLSAYDVDDNRDSDQGDRPYEDYFWPNLHSLGLFVEECE